MLRVTPIGLVVCATGTDLLDAVENMHVRRRAYESAKELSDRFVKLPEVKRYSLFASVAEFQCGGGSRVEK